MCCSSRRGTVSETDRGACACRDEAVVRDGGWRLIAGQYPGGSDDELPALNIVDPTVARDNSPIPGCTREENWFPIWWPCGTAAC